MVFVLDLMPLKFGFSSHQGGSGEAQTQDKDRKKGMSIDLMHFKVDVCGWFLLWCLI